jgi:hypothetical protein
MTAVPLGKHRARDGGLQAQGGPLPDVPLPDEMWRSVLDLAATG